MLRWRKRLPEFWRVAQQHAGLLDVLAMARAVLSGPTPPDVWRSRVRCCLRCPILDRQTMACHVAMRDAKPLGCGCYTPFLALTAAPYPKGCFARQITPREGWPNYVFPNWRAKVRALWRFAFGSRL